MDASAPDTMELVDTHCHLDDDRFGRPLPEVLARARAAGVTRFVIPGVGAAGWEGIARISREHAGVFVAPGLHPMRADGYTPALLDQLERSLDGAVAVGEIGIDPTYEHVPRELQAEAFRGQLRLAVAAGLPVLVHCRRAFDETLRILREERVERVGGIMHAFSGSADFARRCIDLGLLISVAGTVTYGNAVRPPEVVRSVPLDALVLETDAPDMTPEPHRGLPNEPAFMVVTARLVAELKGVSVEELARITTANARRVLKI